MSVIVHLNGWPGSGKLTVGSLLAAKIGARLLDNHAMLNPARALFDRSNANHAALAREVRQISLGFAARVPAGIPLVIAESLADDEMDRALFNDVAALAQKRSAKLVAFTFEIDPEENERRLVSPDRHTHRKLTDPVVLHKLRDGYALLRPEGAVMVDVTILDAERAASEIHQAVIAATSASSLRKD